MLVSPGAWHRMSWHILPHVHLVSIACQVTPMCLGQDVHWTLYGWAASFRSLMGSAVCAQGPCGA